MTILMSQSLQTTIHSIKQTESAAALLHLNLVKCRLMDLLMWQRIGRQQSEGPMTKHHIRVSPFKQKCALSRHTWIKRLMGDACMIDLNYVRADTHSWMTEVLHTTHLFLSILLCTKIVFWCCLNRAFFFIFHLFGMSIWATWHIMLENKQSSSWLVI